MKVTPKYRIAKFDGDDCYSYAVFYSKDIKGLKSPIFFGQAVPIVCGCGRSEADGYKRSLEKEDETKLKIFNPDGNAA